jgi:hypothetical protein
MVDKEISRMYFENDTKTVGTHLGSMGTTERAVPTVTNEIQRAKILL